MTQPGRSVAVKEEDGPEGAEFTVQIRATRGPIRLAMNRRLFLLAGAGVPASLVLPLLLGGCINVKTQPIEVKPIHITVDVNVKVEKALDDFFGDLDKKSATIEAPKP
jgi:hypothetical protein